MKVSMRSIVCEYKDGKFDFVFTRNEVKKDNIKVGPNEVCIKVHACYLARQQPEVLKKLLSKRGQPSFFPSSCISGLIVEVGSNVSHFKVNDRVVGCIPMDSQQAGCTDVCLVNEIYVVNLPPKVNFLQGVLLLNDGVKAYTALHYLAALKANDYAVICNASSSFGCLLVQLAKLWKANVIAVVVKKGEESQLSLQKFKHPPDSIIKIDGQCINNSSNSNLITSVLETTGQLGADVIIDDGVRLFKTENDSLVGKDDLRSWKPSKQELISCLSVGGRWVTCNPLLQIDPGDSMQLYLKQVSVSYLFDQAWVLSSSKMGKWISVVKDLLEKIQDGSIQIDVNSTRVVAFNDVTKLDVSQADVIVSMET